MIDPTKPISLEFSVLPPNRNRTKTLISILAVCACLANWIRGMGVDVDARPEIREKDLPYRDMLFFKKPEWGYKSGAYKCGTSHRLDEFVLHARSYTFLFGWDEWYEGYYVIVAGYADEETSGVEGGLFVHDKVSRYPVPYWEKL